MGCAHSADVSRDDRTATERFLAGAIQRDDEATVVSLLNEQSIECKCGPPTLNDGASHLDRSTPLHMAAFFGRENLVTKMLDRGAKPDAANAVGETALHGAARGGHAGLVMLLLNHGANAHALSHLGHSPFALCSDPHAASALQSWLNGQQFAATQVALGIPTDDALPMGIPVQVQMG